MPTPEKQVLFNTIHAQKNYYDLLGVSPDATDLEISESFKLILSKIHLDKNIDDKSDAQAAFQKVSNAFDILKDKSLRATYDNALQDNQSKSPDEAAVYAAGKAKQAIVAQAKEAAVKAATEKAAVGSPETKMAPTKIKKVDPVAKEEQNVSDIDKKFQSFAEILKRIKKQESFRINQDVDEDRWIAQYDKMEDRRIAQYDKKEDVKIGQSNDREMVENGSYGQTEVKEPELSQPASSRNSLDAVEEISKKNNPLNALKKPIDNQGNPDDLDNRPEPQ